MQSRFALADLIHRLEGLSALIISPQLISITCLSQEHRISIFKTRRKSYMLPKPRTDYLKRTFSYSGAILWNNFHEEICTSNSLRFSREVLLDGFLISTPTRQICKTIFENFYSIFWVRLVFLTVYNSFIHSILARSRSLTRSTRDCSQSTEIHFTLSRLN